MKRPIPLKKKKSHVHCIYPPSDSLFVSGIDISDVTPCTAIHHGSSTVILYILTTFPNPQLKHYLLPPVAKPYSWGRAGLGGLTVYSPGAAKGHHKNYTLPNARGLRGLLPLRDLQVSLLWPVASVPLAELKHAGHHSLGSTSSRH